MSLKETLSTAGGNIVCQQCTARSTRTGLQCGRPALKSSRTQKCQFHGGRSTGPKTAEGRAKIAQAHLIHGNDTKVARAERSADSTRLARLEDAMHILQMAQGPRTRGRKAAGYVSVQTFEDIKRMMAEDMLSSVSRSADAD